MLDALQMLLPIATMLYQAIACWFEDRQPPPGQLVEIAGCRLHLLIEGDAIAGRPTIVVDSSLGGMEGYLLVDALAGCARTCIYDRAGYGWSEFSAERRTSAQIVRELDELLVNAAIAPPYLLVGDSFGTYNVCLYAARYPDKVAGLVLTDGLHEAGMLAMPRRLQVLQAFFLSGFWMSMVGSFLGFIRMLAACRVFEFLKPELGRFPPASLQPIKRSFCRPQHWLTMSRELWNLRSSGEEVRAAYAGAEGKSELAMPIAGIQAETFFQPSIWTALLPCRAADRLRETMHVQLAKRSTDFTPLRAERSDHFVWVDRPDTIVIAVKLILEKLERGI